MADPCAYARCTAQVGDSPYILDMPDEPTKRFCSVTCCWSWFQDHLGVKALAPVDPPVPMPQPVTRAPASPPPTQIFHPAPQPVRRRQPARAETVRVPVFHGAEVNGPTIGEVTLQRRQLPSGMAWHLELQPTFDVHMDPPSYDTQAFHLIVRQVAKARGAVAEGQALPEFRPSPHGLLGMRCTGCGLGAAVCVCGTR